MKTRIAILASLAAALLTVPLAATAQQTLYVIDGNGLAVDKIAPDGTRTTFKSALGSCDALALDAAGNLYVGYGSASGYGGGVHFIAPDGTLTEFTGYPIIANTTGLAFDSAGHLFDAEYGTDASGSSIIHEITQGGVVSTFAKVAGSQRHLAFDAAGNLYVAGQTTGSITKITPDGTESTFASGLDFPWGLVFDAAGNLYVSNYGNGNGSSVTKITPQGAQSTYATGLNGPSGLAFDQNGNLFVANYNGSTITEITPTGVTSIFASGFSQPDAILFSAPTIPVITTDPSATALVGAAYSYQIAATNGATSYTAVGLPAGLNLDGGTGIISGTPTAAGVYTISLFAANAYGTGSGILTLAVSGAAQQTLYVAENSNGVVKVAPDGTQTQFLTGVGGINPITLDADGNLFAGTNVGSGYGGYVLRFTPDGTQSDITSYPAIAQPTGLALDASGNLFETQYDVDSNNNSVLNKITPGGTVTAFATLPNSQYGDAFDSQGNLYVASTGGNSVARITPAGAVSTFATGLDEPYGIAIDANDNVYVANNGNGFGSTVTKITPAGVVSAYATGLQEPFGLAFDRFGNLYVSNYAAHGGVGGTITEITPAGAKGTFAAGFTNPASLAFNILPAATPAITSTPTATVGINQPFSYQITGTNNPTRFGATGLPAGLSVDPTTGLISGTPTQSGTFNAAVSATNALGTTSASLTLTVAAAPVPATVNVTVKGSTIAYESGAKAKFLLTRTGADLSQPLAVNFQLKSSAKDGVDYQEVASPAVIPAGTDSVKVKIKPIENSIVNGTRKAKLKLLPSTDGSYIIGAQSKATITIMDDDTASNVIVLP